jgi:hypothetical protein
MVHKEEFISNLPRLLYIGDVPVESTVAGSALLYRLLQEYPVDRLCIVEGNIAKSQLQNRLPDVDYQTLSVGYERLLRSRLVFLYTSYLFLTAKWRSRQLNKIIKTFKPEAILTVAHGLSWITAAELARKNKLPLHLIVHDEWTSFIAVLPPLKSLATEVFGNIYRQANSRLCVSPYMKEFYKNQYGIEGDVLYPSRAKDIPVFEKPHDKSKKDSPLVFAYAGSIHSKAYAESLVAVASILEKLGDNLVIYSQLNQLSIEQLGLNRPNIITRSLIPSNKLIYTLREEADVLFLPMSFEAEDRSNSEMSFPSKLTDYTAIGLPLLIWGPVYCSAVVWAKANPDVAEVIENQDIKYLSDSIKRLNKSLEYRCKLATNALNVGLNYFSHYNVVSIFYRFITQNKNNT